MTVGELKAALEAYDDDLPVCIGIHQLRGSNFASEIEDVQELTVNDFEYGEEKQVVITEGSQTGIVNYSKN